MFAGRTYSAVRTPEAFVNCMPTNSLESRYQKLKVLYRISDLINTTTNPETLLRRILREAMREMKATCGTIALINTEEQVLEIKVSHGLDMRLAKQMRLKVGEGVTGTVARSGKTERIDDVSACAHYVELQPGVCSELAVPLKVEGEVIGVLNVDAMECAAFSAVDEQLLEAIAAQAARVIHTSQLYDRLAQQTRRLEALFDVGQALISPDPLPEILHRITQAVLQITEIKLCSVMLLNQKRELVLSAVSGGSAHYSQRPNLPVSESLIGEVVTQRQPIQVFDVRKAPRYRSSKMAKRERLASLLAVPILFNEQLIGILNIYTSRPRTFRDEEMRLLEAFASLCAIAIENAQRYERVLQAEQSIRQTDRLATLGILSAEIAHEVRNPVTIISMLIHSLREDQAIAPEREKDAEIIAEKLERINRIVSQVLNFSKRREQPKEWVNMNLVLDDLLFLVNHNISARRIVIRKQFDGTLPTVLGDKGHFDQVFLNLLLNAIEAMPHGGNLTIRTSCNEEETGAADSIGVWIKDSGVGISAEVLPQLFTPFVSTRPEGVGLGLFVSQKLLAQYGGNIEVKSTVEKGTTFKITIPAGTEEV